MLNFLRRNMQLSKEQSCSYLEKLEVKYDGRLNERGLERILRKELKSRGIRLVQGNLFKKITEQDLEKNPELKKKGIKVGEDIGLGGIDEVLTDSEDPEKQTVVPPKPVDQNKEGGTFTMKANVKHNGEAYKKDDEVILNKQTAKVFKKKNWI